ncbi:arrestin domain-containing protein 17-like [Trichogramma pretiosum]|uniref:Arrestin C-terminal-like domain-containing protein n=1 Tax=Trichogramma kaykai TaxID=54128 RepID=A0ABD2WT61_9HYME|nr:arrestin domain-containing protein 17-like [Trichogramma pretiosum]
MPKLQEFQIRLDRSSGIYLPGEEVTGKVIFKLTAPKRIKELRIESQGESKVHWTKHRQIKSSAHAGDREHFKGEERYYTVASRLLYSEDAETTTLEVGNHIYYFSFQLPKNLPCSFEHRTGYVRYTIKAIIDRPWKFNHKTITAFTVLAPYDLNKKPFLALGFDDEFVHKFTMINVFSKGPEMNVHVQNEIRGYVPGQVIEMFVKFNHETVNVELTKIKMELVKELEFISTSPRASKRIETEIISKDRKLGPFFKKDDVSLKILVPALPPSHLENCNIINIEYKIVFTICVSGLHFNVTRKYPIEIGTVPLHHSVFDGWTASRVDMSSAPPFEAVYQSSSEISSPNADDFTVTDVPPYVKNTTQPMLPPTYEECVFGKNNITDEVESSRHGVSIQFAPRYPVYRFSLSQP